jgi:hypothetical protein
MRDLGTLQVIRLNPDIRTARENYVPFDNSATVTSNHEPKIAKKNQKHASKSERLSKYEKSK